jgi:hypothetical protein
VSKIDKAKNEGILNGSERKMRGDIRGNKNMSE